MTKKVYRSNIRRSVNMEVKITGNHQRPRLNNIMLRARTKFLHENIHRADPRRRRRAIDNQNVNISWEHFQVNSNGFKRSVTSCSAMQFCIKRPFKHNTYTNPSHFSRNTMENIASWNEINNHDFIRVSRAKLCFRNGKIYQNSYQRCSPLEWLTCYKPIDNWAAQKSMPLYLMLNVDYPELFWQGLMKTKLQVGSSFKIGLI